MIQQPGRSGFTVEYTRRVFRDEELVRDERFQARYDAQDGILHVGVPSLGPR